MKSTRISIKGWPFQLVVRDNLHGVMEISADSRTVAVLEGGSIALSDSDEDGVYDVEFHGYGPCGMTSVAVGICEDEPRVCPKCDGVGKIWVGLKYPLRLVPCPGCGQSECKAE